MLKKLLSVILILSILLLSSCERNTDKTILELSDEAEHEPAEEQKYIVKTLNAFHVEGIYDMFRFIKNPKENNLYYCLQDTFRFVEQGGRLILKDMRHGDNPMFYDIDGDYVFAEGFSSSEYCSKAVAFLCDENAIRQRFHESGIDGIQDIVVIEFIDAKVGYIIAAVTEKTAYYMTVPLAAEVYGDYIYQKVYTSGEFKRIYGPRPAKVFINGKEVKFSSKTLLGEMYLEMDILDFFKALGFQCKYNEKTKEITAGNYKVHFEYSENGWMMPEEYEEFIESAPVYDAFLTTPEFTNASWNWAKYRDGRFLGSYRFFKNLCRELGCEIEYHYEDCSVRINKKEQK